MLGFVASTTSCTPFASTRRNSSSMRRSPGSTPSSGESEPPSTWYSPRNSCVRSRDTTSTGCSTTQMSAWSRRRSRQMPQSSSSVRLPHSRQNLTRSLTSASAAASARASSFGRCRMWNASRCAVRWPTPGSRVSCATRFSTEGLNTVSLCPPNPTWPPPSYYLYAQYSFDSALLADRPAATAPRGVRRRQGWRLLVHLPIRDLQAWQKTAEVRRQHCLHLRLHLGVRRAQRLVRGCHHEI